MFILKHKHSGYDFYLTPGMMVGRFSHGYAGNAVRFKTILDAKFVLADYFTNTRFTLEDDYEPVEV